VIVRDRNIGISAQTVRGAIAEFMRDVHPRLEKLGKAYEGRGAITGRVRASGLPNNRLVHAFPRYIVTMASGYLVGKPVEYSCKEQEEAVKALREMLDASDIGSIDAELATDASAYGRGVCLCYANEDGAMRCATVSPKTAFVVYDDTVEHKPLFGVHWYERYDEAGKRRGVSVHVYTALDKRVFEGKTVSTITEDPAQLTPHYMGGVPLVEFWNNAQETGDFEPVLSLIDAYDVLESDRVNDKQQFTDAVLLLTGCTLENDDPDDMRSPAQKLLEEKTLSLPDTDAKAEWLVKQSDEAGAETLKDAIKSDIHKMSMVPDLTDENFAANASGVAMRYKLLGLEQLTSIKERWFREGLRSRLRLYAHFMGVLAKGTLDPEKVSMTFTRSLPVNESEAASMVAQLEGIVPKRTLLTQLPFVENVDDAMAQLEKEKAEAAKQQAAAFGGRYLDGNDAWEEEDPEQEREEEEREAQ